MHDGLGSGLLLLIGNPIKKEARKIEKKELQMDHFPTPA